MSAVLLRAAAWLLCAVALLTAGLFYWLHLGALIATAHAAPGAASRVQTAFSVYAQVVLAKGLLPALVLTLALGSLFDWRGRLARRGRLGVPLGLAIAATLASIAVAALLLPLALPGLPSVVFTGTGNFVRTCAEMAAAVMLAAWMSRTLISMSWRNAALAVTALAALLVTAGALVTDWARARAPEPIESAATAASGFAAAPPVPAAAEPAPERDSSGAETPAAESSLPSRAAAPQGPYRPDEEELERRRAAAARLRARIAAGPEASGPVVATGLLAEADPRPVYEDGELLGIELQNVRPDGLFARLGLREGDLVQSINGAPLDESGALLREIIGSPQVVLQVEQMDGTQRDVTVPRQQILEGLQSLE